MKIDVTWKERRFYVFIIQPL